MRYIRTEMYMSIVLNLNKGSCFQLLSNVALNAYYKQHNHKGKTLHEKTKDSSKPYPNPVPFSLAYLEYSLFTGPVCIKT